MNVSLGPPPDAEFLAEGRVHTESCAAKRAPRAHRLPVLLGGGGREEGGQSS